MNAAQAKRGLKADKQLTINETLVRHLLRTQFPQWAGLPLRPILPGGWDNKTFRLGDEMLVRMPSAALYRAQVEKEQQWLPLLARSLPLPIPEPLALGKPSDVYPVPWSIYRWLDGEAALPTRVANINEFAKDLGKFLAALQSIEAAGGPAPGPHSFFRGGSLATYDAQTQQAIEILRSKIDADKATSVWKTALASAWQAAPVWVHGDVSLGNLLVRDSRLCAVIDFGQLAVGDPACDLVIAWTFFEGESRAAFCAQLPLDANTWARGRGWALWKALILASGLAESNAIEAADPWRTIGAVLADHGV